MKTADIMRLKRNFEVTFQLIDGQAYLLKQNIVFKLNDIGVEYWRLLDGKHSVSDIVQELTERYLLPAEKLQSDVQSFFNSMLEHGMASPAEKRSMQPVG